MERNSKKAWLYLLPALVLLAAFLVYPLIDVLVYSVEECFNFASQTYQGIGLYNYSYVLHDPYFLQAVENTFVLVIITVPISTILALLIATALSSIKKLRELYQTIYFLPYVTNTLAVGLVFMVLFQRTVYRRPCQPRARAFRRGADRFHQRPALGQDVRALLLHDLGRAALQDPGSDQRDRLGG